MKRRHVLNYTIAGAAIGASIPAIASAQSSEQSSTKSSEPQAPVRWRMAASYPKSLDVMFGAAELFCRRVSELTQGQFEITAYPSGELAPGLEVLNAVSKGTVECGHTFGTYYVKQSPALGFSAGMPFGFTAQQQNAWLYEGGGLELVRKGYQKFNVINFPAGNTGAQMGGWFQQEIDRASDLKGLKMRIAGLGGQILTRLGAEVKMFAPDQIVQALVKKEIEAVEFVGPYDDSKLGLHKAAAFYYYPAWWQPGESQDVIVNLEQWNQLSPQFQKVVEMAAMEANILGLARYNAENAKMLQRLKADGVKFKPFNAEILAAAERETFALYEEIAQKDPLFDEVYRPWKAFRDRIYRINELSFAKFAFTDEA
jgi:TRAP-type mannitol/chloroaromatic compound transport system substrate-binding protein